MPSFIKRLSLVLVATLSVVCSSASAEWVKLAESDQQEKFFDPSSRMQVGGNVTLWTIDSFKQPQGSPPNQVWSVRSQQEYDCKKRKMRILSITTHSGKMAQGNVILSSGKPDEWISIPPGSGADWGYRAACQSNFK